MSGQEPPSYEELVREIADLRARLQEAEEVLTAIRTGAADALVVEGPEGSQVYTLQGADHSYRVFVETMNEGAVTVAADGTVVYANPVFADLVGEPLEQTLGSAAHRFIIDSDRDQFDGLLREAGRSRSRRELSLSRADGTLIPVQISARRMAMPSGDFACLVVTDLREQLVHDKLRQSEEQLRRTSEAKSRLIHSVSHEYRTPLNSIRALTHLLLQHSDGPLAQEQEKQVRMIRTSAEQLLALVDELLDVSRAEAGKAAVTIGPCAVKDMFAELRSMFELLTREGQVQVRFQCKPVMPVLMTDGGKLMQILRNFVSNALKYTEQGTIDVLAEPVEDGRAVRFAVVDTGIGIAPELQEWIFEEFTQVAHPLQARVKGSGLGLPLCRRLAGLLRARIEVASRLGEGATFSLILPTHVAGDRYAAALPSAVARPRVLLIDDEPTARYVLRGMLDPEACEVLEASDGEMGLRLARDLQPEAILLDLTMPGMSGGDVLAALQADPVLAGIPVALVTSALPERIEGSGREPAQCPVIDKGAISPALLSGLLSEMTGIAAFVAARAVRPRSGASDRPTSS